MRKFGPGLAVHITDYSTDPATLLRDLADSLTTLRDARQLAVLSVGRGWLHGSHLKITARGFQGPAGDTLADDLSNFAELASQLATSSSRTHVVAPPEADYLARAEQLAKWENREPPFLPLYPQGTVRIVGEPLAANWSAQLAQARDQITSRYLDPILATAAVAADKRPALLMQVMAVLARTHRGGIGVGTLPFRSHAEGVSSATGTRADLRSTYAERFSADRQLFHDALLQPITDPLLHQWSEAFHYSLGVAEGLAAAGDIDEHGLASAAGSKNITPMGPLVRSDFFAEMISTGLIQDPPYTHVAYRIVLNTLYATLSCFGISPLQRYYFCFGLAEAADRHLGEDANTRVRRLAAARAGRSVDAVPVSA